MGDDVLISIPFKYQGKTQYMFIGFTLQTPALNAPENILATSLLKLGREDEQNIKVRGRSWIISKTGDLLDNEEIHHISDKVTV